MEEIWKDIKGYEGLYQVSNLGRVKSLDKIIVTIDRKNRCQKGKILKLQISKYGYNVITLWNNNISKQFKVHRLVAIAFIPNPNNLPQINHIDEDKLNNKIDNLEWCTALENNHHSNIAKRRHLAGTEASKKPVSQYEINGTLVANYESASEASRKIGKPQGRSSICKCCNGQLNTYNGYIWKWSS